MYRTKNILTKSQKLFARRFIITKNKYDKFDEFIFVDKVTGEIFVKKKSEIHILKWYDGLRYKRSNGRKVYHKIAQVYFYDL